MQVFHICNILYPSLRRRRLHRHRLPARRVLQGHDPHRLPVGHLRHVDARSRLLDDELLPALQHQHPRLSPVLRPQDLPDGLLHHHAVLLLLLGMVLNVLLLLLLGSNSVGNNQTVGLKCGLQFFSSCMTSKILFTIMTFPY